jgi:hypothetical protein
VASDDNGVSQPVRARQSLYDYLASLVDCDEMQEVPADYVEPPYQRAPASAVCNNNNGDGGIDDDGNESDPDACVFMGEEFSSAVAGGGEGRAAASSSSAAAVSNNTDQRKRPYQRSPATSASSSSTEAEAGASKRARYDAASSGSSDEEEEEEEGDGAPSRESMVLSRTFSQDSAGGNDDASSTASSHDTVMIAPAPPDAAAAAAPAAAAAAAPAAAAPAGPPVKRVCFWICGVGFAIDTDTLEGFLGGDHMLALFVQRGAAMHEGIIQRANGELAAITDVNALRAHDTLHNVETTHVVVVDSDGMLRQSLPILPAIFDFMVRRADDPHCSLCVDALPSGNVDATAIDVLCDYLFYGRTFAFPCTVFCEAISQVRARIALLPPMVKAYVTPAASLVRAVGGGAANTRRRDSRRKASPLLEDEYYEKAIPMVYDPLWIASCCSVQRVSDSTGPAATTTIDVDGGLRYNELARCPRIEASSPAFRYALEDIDFATEVADRDGAPLPHDLVFDMLAHYYNIPLTSSDLKTLANDAIITLVDRGTPLRVVCAPIENGSVARGQARTDPYTVGLNYKVIVRKEEENRLSSQLDALRIGGGASARNAKRRNDAEAALNDLLADDTAEWRVL